VPQRLKISPIAVWSLGARTAVGTVSVYAGTKGAIDTPAKYFATALGPQSWPARHSRQCHPPSVILGALPYGLAHSSRTSSQITLLATKPPLL
jgi:hypothetical protein